MRRNPFETILGAVILVVAVLFLAFAYSMSDIQTVKGYTIKASFYKAGGLEMGSDVRISGIKVGSVTKNDLDLTDYSALVEMSIRPDIKIPKDSVATIVGDGLMGGKYLKIEPGSSNEYIKNEETIRKTRDYKSLEDSVGEIIFMVTKPAKGKNG